MTIEKEAVWSRLALGDALTSDPELAQIEARFAREYEAAGRPADMALFKRHDTEHSLHCVVTVYFSPAARSAGKAVGAAACGTPSRFDLELLAGDPRCWGLLFPKRDPDDRNPTPVK